MNIQFDTHEERGCFVWSILIGVGLGIIGALSPMMRNGAFLALAGLLIVIGARWMITAFMDWLYRDV